MMPWMIVYTVLISSTPPAAPSRCPNIDLFELTGIVRARSPNTALIACASHRSLNSVDVPCALM